MSLLEAVFIVTKEKNCPFYDKNDEFRLSINALHMPPGKPTCMILAEDIKKAFDHEEIAPADEASASSIKCSGCTGSIEMAYEINTEYVFETDDPHEKATDNIAKLLSKFSFFQTLKKEEVKYFVPFIRHKQFEKGEIIIKKGEGGKHLYVILSGMVEVVGQNEVNIAFLGKGEIFGEMSLLSGESVGATIRAVEPTKVIYLNSRNFRKLLRQFPTLYAYFTNLLTRRVEKTNIARAEDFESGMNGDLAEMPPSELLQTFNMNRKTGVLKFSLPHDKAVVVFKEGDPVRARFGELEDKEAFWAVLKEKTGRFQFIPGLPPEEENSGEIGQFMWLLMEGLSRMDEETHGQEESDA